MFFLLFFFFMCFLEMSPIKSCLCFCLGVLIMSGVISLGVHTWYSYFLVLVFLSGVLSLLVYCCSFCFSCSDGVGYSVIFFLLFLFFFFGGCYVDYIWYYDYNFLLMYYDFNFVFVVWFVLVLLFFLNFISFNLNVSYCLRCLS